MSKVLVTSGHLQDIADAIRVKNRESTLYRPGDMAAAIRALEDAGYPEPTGSVEITGNGTYDVKDVAEAVVNVSAGSGILELNFDFTQSMTDTVRGVTALTSGITRDASGAAFSGATSYIRLRPRYSANTYTYEIDVASVGVNTNNSHSRFIMGNDSCGLIYRYTGKWAFYSNNGGWQDTSVTSKTYFNGTTIKVYVDQNGKWHIYRNGTLWFEPNGAQTLDTGNTNNASYFMIGSGAGNGVTTGTTITGLRVY